MPPDHWIESAGLAGIFFLTFLSEDAATLAAAVFVAEGKLPWLAAYLSCFAGIWIGDLGLFALARVCGRPILERFWSKSPTVRERIADSEEWFQRHNLLAFVLCRFLPGTRVPTFLAAGFLRMSVVRFATITGVLAAAWVGIVFIVVKVFGRAAERLFHFPYSREVAVAVGVLLVVAILVFLRRRSPAAVKPARSWSGWEFWPAWLFYLPIAFHYVWLSIRHGGLHVPLAANPGMFTGGMIGESKFETLAQLEAAHPEFVAPSLLLPEGTPESRMSLLQAFASSKGGGYPLVLKPDVGQRGSGFRVIPNEAAALDYLTHVPVPVVAQRFIPGPLEAGLFYYRLPTEARGKILAITEKIFPVLTGDGVRTLEELVMADDRARVVAEVYLQRFDSERRRVLAPGESLRLVQAGNHAQGCIFRDGMDLWSEALEERLETLSRSVPGFFVGRYDVRFAEVEALRRGEGFSILELNGAASEATSAYDGTKSLRSAYALLFRQWEIVFAIGAANMRRGHKPESFRTMVSEWWSYRERSRCHPAAD